MLAELKKVRFPVEMGLLIAFCIFLPLVEFWKAVAWLAYVLVWLGNRIRSRDLGGDWRLWDTLIVVWIGSAYLAAAFAGLGGNAWSKTGDLATHTLLLWLVMRARYTERELRWILGALVASTAAGLAHGYWRISQGLVEFDRLQLNSVGHVNHTAIYLAIMLGVGASWIFARAQKWRRGRGIIALAVVATFLASLVVTASRGAVAIGLLLLLVLAAAWWPRWRGPLLVSAFATVIVSLLLIGFGGSVVQKQLEYATTENTFSYRDGIWRMGIAAWEKYPWFGVGKDNYSFITHDLVRGWRSEAGKDFDPRHYVRSPHAHSLYVNTLAERGAVGFAALASLMVAWLAALVRHRPRREDSDFAWLAWGGATSAWLVTAGVGMVNTTFHHEHGLLAALLLALWLSTLRARPVS
jgi:O-antigen ligase